MNQAFTLVKSNDGAETIVFLTQITHAVLYEDQGTIYLSNGKEVWVEGSEVKVVKAFLKNFKA